MNIHEVIIIHDKLIMTYSGYDHFSEAKYHVRICCSPPKGITSIVTVKINLVLPRDTLMLQDL